MKERIQFLFIYFGFWFTYFVTARIIFLSYHIQDTKLLTLEVLAGVFLYGAKMDMSMSAYLCILPFLWVILFRYIKKSIFERILYGYTLIFVFIISLIIVVDLEVYNVWKYRLDATPLQYLASPREALASVKSSPFFRLVISYIILLIVASYFVYRIIGHKINTWKSIKKMPFMAVALFLTASLILPIRGGLGIAPMNQSSVYFSDNNFANIAAVNASWNFFSSMVNNNYDKVNPYTYMPNVDLDLALGELFPKETKSNFIIDRKIKKPNVLIIIWESFTEKVVDESNNGVVITPFFNELKNEGVYFSNTYASGDRTDKGIVSILSGYPAQPTKSIIKDAKKTTNLPILTKDFQRNGYSTSFYYGGNTEFANMKTYLYAADFQRIVELNDFPEEMHLTKWGVHDKDIFDKFLNEHSYARKDPFFETILTLSSHEPFDVPMDSPTIIGDTEEELFLNSLHYTDNELRLFIESAKKQSWWQESIVIIIGDHGHRLPETGNRTNDFRTPMLWTGGAIKQRQVISEVTSQIDLAKILLDNLEWPSKEYVWSKNPLNGNPKPAWAYFSFNDGFGYIKENKEFLFDNIGKKIISKKGEITDLDIRNGKALEQKSYQDYLDK